MPYDSTDLKQDTEVDLARARMIQLRDFLRKLSPEEFDMGEWKKEYECGTVCCIGGWAQELFEGDALSSDAIGALIGLNLFQSELLFFPRYYTDAYSATIPQAIRVLDIFLAEGKIDWPRAMKEA